MIQWTIQGNQYFCYENIVKHSQNVTLFSRSPFENRILHTGPQKSSAKERDIETVSHVGMDQATDIYAEITVSKRKRRGRRKEDVSTTKDVRCSVYDIRTRDCVVEKIHGKNEFEPGFGHA